MLMKKINIFIFLAILLLTSLSLPKKVFAALNCTTWVKQYENIVTIDVSGVQEYLEKEGWENMRLSVYRETKTIDSVKDYKIIEKDGSYDFSTMLWRTGSYEVQFNPTSGWASVLANCWFSITPTYLEPVDVTCNNGAGINTALGCIPIKSESFIGWLLNFSVGIGGGIAFLLMIFGAFQIILSAGNPDRVKAGKEMITSAIAGLLLIIFSIFILRVIGYDILAIPGFDKY